MKISPKEIMVVLPAVHLFNNEEEIPALAAGVNTIIHGKVKIKYETLGHLNGKIAGLFYINRDNDSQSLRDQFMQLIEREELMAHNAKTVSHDYCLDCDAYSLLHQKGILHCQCGGYWVNNKCSELSSETYEDPHPTDIINW